MYTPEQIKEAFKKLPQIVREAITSTETTEATVNIGKKYGLHVDKLGILSQETGYAILGLTPTADLPQRLKQVLGLDDSTVNSLASDLNQQIFLKIREFVQETTETPINALVPAPSSVENILEPKIQRVTTTLDGKPWEGDPYLERP